MKVVLTKLVGLKLVATVETHAVTGGLCALNPGSDLWEDAPDDAWFLIVADDGGFTEGSWGSASSGLRRPGVPSGQCSMSARDDSETCP